MYTAKHDYIRIGLSGLLCQGEAIAYAVSYFLYFRTLIVMRHNDSILFCCQLADGLG